MDDDYIVLPCECNYLNEEIQLHGLACRIMGKGEHEISRSGPGLPVSSDDGLVEIAALDKRNGAHVGARDNHRINVDGVGRVGHQRHLSRLDDRQGKVRESLLDSDDGDRFGFRIN